MPGALRTHTVARRRTLLLAIVALLLQMALAAHACNLPQDAMIGMPAMASTPEMGSHRQRQADHTLCIKHCTPDRAVSTDTRPSSVPASMLEVLLPTRPTGTIMALKQTPPQRIYPPPDPPPPAMLLLFCSLLL